jgi:clan AA aspartic protease (TIGR02281 family)
MESQSLQRWAMKELLIWSAAIAGGFLTFSSFEAIYDRVKFAATRAGYARMFDAAIGVAGVSQFDTRVLGAALPFRGTIPASQGLPPSSRKTVVLTANPYGHFHADAEINGQKVEFMMDTGATYVALAYETAQALGLTPQNLRFSGRSTTANGVARVASVNISAIRIGGITVKDVQAVVAEPGRMAQNLLGMSFIKQLSVFELKDNALTMKE